MGRTMSETCATCGQITDWGDFGAEDGSSKSQCICPPVDSVHLIVTAEEFTLLMVALFDQEEECHRLAWQASKAIGTAAVQPLYDEAAKLMALGTRLENEIAYPSGEPNHE